MLFLPSLTLRPLKKSFLLDPTPQCLGCALVFFRPPGSTVSSLLSKILFCLFSKHVCAMIILWSMRHREVHSGRADATDKGLLNQAW